RDAGRALRALGPLGPHRAHRAGRTGFAALALGAHRADVALRTRFALRTRGAGGARGALRTLRALGTGGTGRTDGADGQAVVEALHAGTAEVLDGEHVVARRRQAAGQGAGEHGQAVGSARAHAVARELAHGAPRDAGARTREPPRLAPRHHAPEAGQ